MGGVFTKIRERIALLSPEGLLVAGFAGLIALGTGLLCLPWSQRGSVGLLDALFTATSAVCVTGLVVVDTGEDFTALGQIIILILIQAGGIGVMFFAAMAFQLLGQRLSLRAQAALSSSLLQREVASEFKGMLRRVLGFVLIAESIGALLLFAGMSGAKGAGHSAYSAIFHSISAFCNAGFSLYSDSLMALIGNPVIITTMMILIVLGGIGHPVVMDLWSKLPKRGRIKGNGPNRLALNSTVALVTSAILILTGAALLVALGLTPGERSWTSQLWNGLFQSVSARTAGFNTVDIGALPMASLLAIVLLMFVGGCPGSCAGGIKTTTLALWISTLWHLLKGGKGPRLLGLYIPNEIVRRAMMIISLSLFWNVAGLLLLLATERAMPDVGMDDLLFEQISAFGTVGLSTGITSKLSVAGKIWITITMFVGRLGPLTLAVSAFTRKDPGIKYPEGRIMIG